MIAGMLVEAKQSVIENMAPVLTYIFTPLFTVLLAVFLGATLVTGSGIDMKRETLIGFDPLLVLVVGLHLYALSARDPQQPAGFFDYLQFALVICALPVDAMALWAIGAIQSIFDAPPSDLLLILWITGGGRLQLRLSAWRGCAAQRWQTAAYGLWVASFLALMGFVAGSAIAGRSLGAPFGAPWDGPSKTAVAAFAASAHSSSAWL